MHLQGWNKLRVELTTHAREGLTENDFIMAAKLNAVPKDDLLSKKKPKPAGEGDAGTA
jgi:4a-hydroxytetrahydrobiopterin dehydratase